MTSTHTPPQDPFAQHKYQVRFDWGMPGARAIGASADVIVWVDVLGQPASNRAPAVLNSARGLAEGDTTVIAASLRNRRAVAEWVLERQGDRGDRFTVAVVAAGEMRDDGSPRFALEDLLGAGALIDALADLGIDYCSPEAATASAAFTGLRNATGHLIGSSGSGQQLILENRRSEVERATELDVSREVDVLREFGPGQ